ncbi:hypothetical protein FACS1894204_04930 [Synergistales bacterium]|nr:hypothetical protein FACS1894204_04930 [Synergistales bacterium]
MYDMSEKWIDQSWKDVLAENLDDAISFFMPDLAADRDYSEKITMLDSALPVIDSGTDKGKRDMDVCLKIPLSGGKSQCVTLCIEQQHKPDESFSLRVFQEYYRALDKFRVPVTSLAIFTGNIKAVDIHSSSCYGSSLNFRYNVYHVLSADIEELRQDKRVFALVVLAARRMLDAGGNAGDPIKRGKYSLELLDLTRERGYDNEKTRSLLKFIGHILRVNDEKIDSKVRETWKMRWVPIDEVVRDIHIRDAREEGEERGKKEMARNLLSNGVPPDIIAKSSGLSMNDIQCLMN